MAMILNSRSMLLAAALAAFPLAGAVAQAIDTGKSTGPSSAAGGDKRQALRTTALPRRAPSRATRRKLMFLAA